MKIFYSTTLLFLVGINCVCQINCDSTLFKYLINVSNQNSISVSEFQKCEEIVNKLREQKCYDYLKTVKGENYVIATLTYLFGKICVKADSDLAVKSYINYMQLNKGSAEEQLDFSFENIFVRRPENVLMEIIRQDSSSMLQMLSGLAWGFVNNRAYGITDPFSDNQFKGMTLYNNPPKVILDSTNYRFIYFSLNPEIKKLYPKYRKQMEFVLNEALNMIRFNDQHLQK